MTVRLWTIYRLDWVRIAIPDAPRAITLPDGQVFCLSATGEHLYSADQDGALWIAPTRSANEHPGCPPDWRPMPAEQIPYYPHTTTTPTQE